jgi:hypothetical protein
LVCGVLNGRKGNREILDPADIQDDWFEIAFTSLLVRPGDNIGPAERDSVRETIDVLGLNDESSCVKARREYVDCYCRDDITYEYLASHAPFLAKELQRQGLRESIKKMWRGV